jgi:hypothetical protein
VEGSTAPVAFPLELWTGVNEQYLQTAAGGVRVYPPRGLDALVATYPALIAPAAGKYRFSLRRNSHHMRRKRTRHDGMHRGSRRLLTVGPQAEAPNAT